jgi:hypothetical protein
MATNLTSSDVSSGEDILATHQNAIRDDIVKNAGDFEVTAGSSNAYTLSIDSGYTSYSDGDKFRWIANFSNTASPAPTLSVNSIGAKTMVKPYDQDLGDGDILSGQYYECVYDATLDKMVLITARGIPTSQAGTANDTSTLDDSSGGAFSNSVNLDIDVSPFTQKDIVLVYWTAQIRFGSVNGSPSNEYNSAHGSFVSLIGGAGAGWTSQANSGGSVTSGDLSTPWENNSATGGKANDDQTNLNVSCTISPGSAFGTATINAPVWANTNLRFSCTHTGTNSGSTVLQPDVYVSAVAIKLA